ncbi:unnamed protein product [Calicophoron daubneyi]|uniref:Quinolinate phosphoribosyltransferase [decarboxylating] n=1 Tax=Calicophoron daubneyi TaxID=300641 RepID=A0AAV2TIZ5_CALDB
MAYSLVLNQQCVRNMVNSWLSNEPAINYVGFALNRNRCSATIRMRGPGTLAGSPFVDAVLRECNCQVQWHIKEGEYVESREANVATITGEFKDILFSEHLASLLLSRASGIASFARRLRKILTDISWKGDLRVPYCLTPGFELVEEYAMTLAGVTCNRPQVFIRQCHAKAAGGIEKAVDLIRSKVGLSTKVEAECSSLSEALAASVAGCSLIVFSRLPMKELTANAAQLKNAHPQVQVQLNGTFDEANLKTYATSNVDFLASSKFCNGYPCLDFQMLYDAVEMDGEARIDLPVQTGRQSDDSESTDEVNSSEASAPKKTRLDDSTSDNSKVAAPKSNGTPRNANAPVSSTVNTPKEQIQKRSQRNQRHQQHGSQRQNSTRSQSPGGMQLLQMTPPRFLPPSSVGRAPGSPPGGNMPNPLSGVLNQPPQPNMSIRLPNQPMPQRMGPGQPSMNPGMLGNGPGVGGGFLSMQPQPPQGNPGQPPNWPIIGGGANPMIGGMGLGLRMGGPGGGNIPSCRTCGSANPPGMMFCRNCRSQLR